MPFVFAKKSNEYFCTYVCSMWISIGDRILEIKSTGFFNDWPHLFVVLIEYIYIYTHFQVSVVFTFKSTQCWDYQI